jgi:ATP:ADP antiporter, AAA family
VSESNRPDSNTAASAATLTAAAMIAQQVGGKATRDALFLTTFDVTSLPYMFIGAALFSLGVVFAFSRILGRFGPGRALPITFVASAIGYLLEWALLGLHPKFICVLIYLHIAGVGGVLISGFWSVVNERFDPRAAKSRVARIAAGATFGGLIGGLLAERVSEALTMSAMLPIFVVLHLFCAWRIRAVNGTTVELRSRQEIDQTVAPKVEVSAWNVIRQAPYLRNLAFLVLLTSIANISLGYVFKAQAVASYGGGEALLRFFAVFYTLVGLCTFIVQMTVSSRALESLGLSRTVGSLPLVVATGSAGAALAPGLVGATLANGAGSIINDSLFRSGYEILYTPIPPKEKRATKSFIDVACHQLGELAGGGVIQLILFAFPGFSIPAVIGFTTFVSLVGLFFTRRLHKGYVVSLERGMKDRAVELDLSEVTDSTTRSVVLRIDPQLRSSITKGTPGPLSQSMSSHFALGTGLEPFGAIARTTGADASAARASALRSGNAQRVRQALQESSSEAAPQIILLLAWDEVAQEGINALRKLAPKISGQLLDALLDPDQDFTVQRRIPKVLTACPTQRVADGLMEAMANRRFEVRFQCGWALYNVVQENNRIALAAERVFGIVRREATAGKKIWESRHLLDSGDELEVAPFVDDVLRDRSSRSMEHVFRLLSLVLPKQPLQMAFRGLYAGDENLRGIALEYLESVLPDEVRAALWPYLEDRRSQVLTTRSREEILETLLRSHESIELHLAALRSKSGLSQ